MKNQRLKYLILFIIFIIIEFLIAIYLKKGFIRENIGDILVVPCIYTFLKTLFLNKYRYLDLYVLIFAIIIEILQLFNITTLIANNNKVINIVLGCTFDFKDIICYIIGYLIIVIVKGKNYVFSR